MKYPGFCSGSSVAQSLNADNEQLINWYPEMSQSQYAKTRQALYPTPGFSRFVTVTDVGGRALATMNGRTFAVMGTGVYGVTEAMVATKFGTVTQDSNPAQFAFNGVVGNEALIASGTNGYNLNLTTNVLTQVLTGKASQVGMLDTFGIAFDATQGRIYTSNSNDFTTWDPTQFIARTDAPDTWKAICVNPPDIWALGSLSGSVLYDAGNFPFPLAPRPGLNFKYGIIAPFSIAASGPTVIWLSQSQEGAGIVVRTRGYSPQRVSTYAVETAIASYARDFIITDAEAMVYQDQGHTFYCLRFPKADQTWVYDLELDTWHRRGYWNAPANQYDIWRARAHTYNFGKHLTAEETSNTIAVMDVNTPTELNGAAIRRLRRAPGIFSDHLEVPIRRIDLYLESGTSLQSGQGSNAMIMWRTSDDGGRTWGNERNVPIGLVGQYQAVVRMNRMGISRDRVNELTVSDPITSWRIVDAYINNDDGRK
jgi:hypothetical protein